MGQIIGIDSPAGSNANPVESNMELSSAPNAAQLSDQANKPLTTAVSLTPTADDQGFRHPMVSQFTGGNLYKTNKIRENIMETKAKMHQTTVYDFGRGIRRFYKNMTMEFACRIERMAHSQTSSSGGHKDGPIYYDLDDLLVAFEKYVKTELTKGSGIKFDGVRMME